MMKILISEDNKLIREITESILSKYGKCDFADNGIKACSMYLSSIEKNNPYDVVLLDIMMPMLSGFQVLEKIRSIEKSNNITKSAVIIMVSSINDRRNINKAISMGADGFIIKPIDENKIKTIFKEKNLIL